jgi:hypothetical protein
MAVTFERFTATPLGAVTLVDKFAQLRGTRGPFPPLVGAVRFTLVEQISDGPILLDPPFRLSAEISPTSVYIFSNEVTTGAGPVLRFPTGRFRLRIESDFYQSLELELDFPLDPANMPILNLKPSAAYPFPDLTVGQSTLTLLYGGLFEIGGGKPIEGAVVTIVLPDNDWPFNSSVTGPNGDWALVMPVGSGAALEPLTLRFDLPDGNSFDVPDVQALPGAVNSLPQTALRGRVLNANGAPIPRATVTVSVQQGESLVAADGQWFFYLSLLQPNTPASVIAHAPGSVTQEQDVQIRNRATVVVPEFRIPLN